MGYFDDYVGRHLRSGFGAAKGALRTVQDVMAPLSPEEQYRDTPAGRIEGTRHIWDNPPAPPNTLDAEDADLTTSLEIARANSSDIPGVITSGDETWEQGQAKIRNYRDQRDALRRMRVEALGPQYRRYDQQPAEQEGEQQPPAAPAEAEKAQREAGGGGTGAAAVVQGRLDEFLGQDRLSEGEHQELSRLVQSGDFASAQARLDQMVQSGAISEDEYQSLSRRVQAATGQSPQSEGGGEAGGGPGGGAGGEAGGGPGNSLSGADSADGEAGAADWTGAGGAMEAAPPNADPYGQQQGGAAAPAGTTRQLVNQGELQELRRAAEQILQDRKPRMPWDGLPPKQAAMLQQRLMRNPRAMAALRQRMAPYNQELRSLFMHFVHQHVNTKQERSIAAQKEAAQQRQQFAAEQQERRQQFAKEQLEKRQAEREEQQEKRRLEREEREARLKEEREEREAKRKEEREARAEKQVKVDSHAKEFGSLLQHHQTEMTKKREKLWDDFYKTNDAAKKSGQAPDLGDNKHLATEDSVHEEAVKRANRDYKARYGHDYVPRAVPGTRTTPEGQEIPEEKEKPRRPASELTGIPRAEEAAKKAPAPEVPPPARPTPADTNRTAPLPIPMGM